MKYPKIHNYLCNRPFAMASESFSQIFSILDGDRDVTMAMRLFAAKEAFVAEFKSAIDSAAKDGGIGILPIQGMLIPYAGDMREISGPATSIQTLQQSFDVMNADPAISTIVLAIDSAGGEITDLLEFTDSIYEARSKKKIYSFVNGVAASAALVIASAAEEIYMADTAMVGSLGVMMAMKSEKDDSDIVIISSKSPNKNHSADTEEGRAKYQAIVDDLYDVIAGRVAQYRGITMETIEKQFGGGDMFTSGNAIKAGLADARASLKELVSKITGTVKTKSVQAQAVTVDEITAVLNRTEKAMSELEILAKENEELKAKLETKAGDDVAAFVAELERDQLITPAMKQNLTFLNGMDQNAREAFKASLIARGKAYNDKPAVLSGEGEKEKLSPIVLPAGEKISQENASAWAESLAFAEQRYNKPSNTLTKEEIKQAIMDRYRQAGKYN